MAPKILIVALLLCSAHAANEASFEQQSFTSKAAVAAMEQVFSRSEKAHAESMATIMKTMGATRAWRVLETHNLTTPALIEVKSDLHGNQARLRKQPKGYGGIDGARKLLNDMIYESMSKYDAEIAKCTEYYASQCAAMESCRGQIAASNYIAANSRSLILDSQSTINKCEVDIPTGKLQLKNLEANYKHEKKKLHQRLAIVQGDISVMTMILKMTDCESKKFIQMQHLALLRCENPCTKTSFVTFNHDGLKAQVAKLQSSTSHALMQDSFSDLFEGIEGLEQTEEFLQLDAHQQPIIDKTKFNNPPTPRTPVPGNPCSDPFKGAPSAADKRAAKCTIKKSPQCYKLQERFLLIQAGIKDERDDLLEEIASLENYYKDTKETLESQIQNDEDELSAAQTKLAGATEKEATAGETARQTAKENEQLDNDLMKQMKSCSSNYINFETELCALKKIRGELYKMKGGGHSAFFQDCEVSKWDPEECSKVCQGGEQKLTRNVMTHPNGGAKCLPLAALRGCNRQPCPVDCKLHAWSGWSKCSAECGGGVTQRLREVKMAMKYGGNPCGATSQTKACNGQSCEANCKLSSWTKWSTCSKACDGGTRKRMKFVKTPATGAGKCPGKWAGARLAYKKCNMFGCMDPKKGVCSTWEKDEMMYTCENAPTCCDGYTGMGLTEATVQCVPISWGSDSQYKVKCGQKPMICNKKLDIVFLLDGSGSLGKKGWAAEIKAANMFVDSFSGSGAQAEMSVILYSGPRTWSGVSKCTGKSSKKVDMEKMCNIKSVTHFTNDMKKVKSLITGLTWPRGSTLTSLALMTAQAELSLGRKDANSIVVVITDGRPLSYRNTLLASRSLRKKARLVWVAVTKYAPLKNIKKWATREWQENVVLVKEFKDLETTTPVNRVIANICPKTSQKMSFGRP